MPRPRPPRALCGSGFRYGRPFLLVARIVQSSERDACFRKFSSIDCDEPFTRNGREARLLRRCGRVDDLEKALQGFDIVYRGQLSSVKLAEALREILKDVSDEPDPFYDDIEGIHFKLEDVDTETVEGICKKLTGEDKPKTPSIYWTCECGMARNLQNQETWLPSATRRGTRRFPILWNS